MEITSEKIRLIAPDEGTLERAKGLALSYLWKELKGNESILWGKYESTESHIYEPKVYVPELNYHCTCPSRKAPCKHVLALLLLKIKESAAIINTAEETPQSIRLWLKSLEEAKEKSAANQEIADKNRAKRLEQMAAGVEELEIWLSDMIQQGLAALEGQDEGYWQAVGAKMVDAKLGSIGRKLKLFVDLAGTKHWHEQLLMDLSELYLLAQGFKRMELLPEALQQEILTVAGIAIKKQEVLDQHNGITDNWLAIGQTSGKEDKILYRRTWFLGEKTQHQGMVLEHAPAHIGFDTSWTVGAVYQGETLYYPSVYPLRMLFRQFRFSNEPFSNFVGFEDFEAFLEAYAEATAAHPWIVAFPALLEDVIPVVQGEDLLLLDKNRKFLNAKMRADSHWKLLALSGGHSICVFGEWEKGTFFVMSALAENRLVVL